MTSLTRLPHKRFRLTAQRNAGPFMAHTNQRADSDDAQEFLSRRSVNVSRSNRGVSTAQISSGASATTRAHGVNDVLAPSTEEQFLVQMIAVGHRYRADFSPRSAVLPVYATPARSNGVLYRA